MDSFESWPRHRRQFVPTGLCQDDRRTGSIGTYQSNEILLINRALSSQLDCCEPTNSSELLFHKVSFSQCVPLRRCELSLGVNFLDPDLRFNRHSFVPTLL